MAFDSKRVVPWRRLLTEWLVVTVVIAVLFATVFDVRTADSYVGLVVGGVLYVLIGALLAKFGYQRATLRDLRAAARTTPSASAPPAVTRAKPAPTRRTSTGPSQRPHRSTKARRR
jgi:hypothetical protein